ncbi:hypothetical protein [Kitasatospora sp. NPDC008115]|uniref:hypothetical protein n=1 Tax=Kitasatospora sp. NPDC008115 TaxID=3364022 RepID=UPI0036F09539
MEEKHPFVRDIFPDLVAELAALLEDEGEHGLAVHVRDIRLVAECGCGDDFCQSLRTGHHLPERPFGEGHRCVELSPSTGMLVLDVVDERIAYIEVLGRPPMPRRGAER